MSIFAPYGGIASLTGVPKVNLWRLRFSLEPRTLMPMMQMFLGQADRGEIGKLFAQPHNLDQLSCAFLRSDESDSARKDLVGFDQRAKASRVNEFKSSAVKKQMNQTLILQIVDLCLDRRGTINIEPAVKGDEPTAIQLM